MIVQRKSLNLHHVQGVEMFEDIVSTKKKKQKLEEDIGAQTREYPVVCSCPDDKDCAECQGMDVEDAGEDEVESE